MVLGLKTNIFSLISQSAKTFEYLNKLLICRFVVSRLDWVSCIFTVAEESNRITR